MAPTECRLVVISPAGVLPRVVPVSTRAIPVVDKLWFLGFGVNFQGHITPWCQHDPTLVWAVVHCLARIGLSAYPRAVIKEIMVSVLPVWLWGVELWGL